MGWGQEIGPTVVAAGKRLADAVRLWEAKASTGNAEAMVEARKEFDRLLEIAS